MKRDSQLASLTRSCSERVGPRSRLRVGVERFERDAQVDAVLLHAYPIACRASQVRAVAAVSSGAVPAFDREDLEQEGLLAYWRAIPHFNPNRASLRTFVEHVVAAHLTSLHRARCSRPCPQPIDEDQHRVGGTWAHEIELRADVQRAVNRLSDADRQLALALIGHTPTEVSRLLGVARSTVYKRIQHIRTQFVDAGLRPQGALRA
jgi:RNA polymerase sigma factor (sigma-70 family)